MSARGWVERLSEARANPATQQPPSRARPGPDPKGSALRVVLVSRDNMLAGALRSLVEAPGGVRVLDWYSEELDSAIHHADVFIVDMPPNLHERSFAVIDGRFLGRTVVLLQEGEHAEALPPGPPRAILYRPVQIGELWMAVTGTTAPEAADVESETEDQAPVEAEPEVDDQAPTHEEAIEETHGTAAAVKPEGLPVAESGRLIGLSGQELDPVTGPGQVAPGMDGATLERLRGWGSRGQEPPAGRTGPPPATRPTAGREKARQAKAAQAEEAEEARKATAAQAEAERVAREAKAEQARQLQAAKAEARAAAREESRLARAAAREQKRTQAKEARAARAVTRKAARAEARQAKAARVEERRAVRAEARRAAGAPSGAAARGRVGWLVRSALIVVAVAALGLAAAGWRGGGGPDTLAGEVAVVRAAGGSGGGLVVQEPRVGPIEPLHALAVGAWLRATEAGGRWRGRSGRPGCRAGSCWRVWSC